MFDVVCSISTQEVTLGSTGSLLVSAARRDRAIGAFSGNCDANVLPAGLSATAGWQPTLPDQACRADTQLLIATAKIEPNWLSSDKAAQFAINGNLS